MGSKADSRRHSESNEINHPTYSTRREDLSIDDDYGNDDKTHIVIKKLNSISSTAEMIRIQSLNNKADIKKLNAQNKELKRHNVYLQKKLNKTKELHSKEMMKLTTDVKEIKNQLRTLQQYLQLKDSDVF